MKRSSRLTSILLCSALLCLFAAFVPSMTFSSTSPRAALQDVWQQVEDVGVYEYQTEVIQTAHPLPILANVGLHSTETHVYIQGNVNRPDQRLSMAMWDGKYAVTEQTTDDTSLQQIAQGLNNGINGATAWVVPQNSVFVRVEGEEAYGKVGQYGEWKPLDDRDTTQLFAPGKDLLGYLSAATNVRRELAEEDSSTRYTFQVDGEAFARFMNEKWQEDASTTLPVGMRVDMAKQYAKMTGSGTIWVDENGLPQRQEINVSFPHPYNQETVSAIVRTSFSNWQLDDQQHAWFALPQWNEDQYRQTGFSLALIGLFLGMMTLLASRWQSRRVYLAVSLSIIMVIVSTPLIRGLQVSAFAHEQQTKQEKHQQQEEAHEILQQVEAEMMVTPGVDPHTDPLLAHRTLAAAISANAAQAHSGAVPLDGSPLAAQATDWLQPASRDSDGDGLSNDDEKSRGTNRYRADTDGDGLSDGQEVLRLGTDPTNVDTDGDGISDKTEVQGFRYRGENWYLNALDPDSNKDGLSDGIECAELQDVQFDLDKNKSVLNTSVDVSGKVCPDTDGDGIPDVWDDDNDNDKLSDRIDESPVKMVSEGFKKGEIAGFKKKTLDFKLENVAPGKSTFVNFQLRPANPDHLFYAMNVLDWPSGDRAGQVQRVHDTTFRDINSASSPTDANGDMRLVPMLEIEIPYQQGSAGGLPTKCNAAAGACPQRSDDMGDWLDSWLDQEEMEKYGIAVNTKDDRGTLVAYVPLNVVKDPIGGAPVAFSGRMFYRPNSSNFGKTQDVRLVWLVQAITDQCTQVPDEYMEGEDDTVRYDTWCEDNNNWQSSTSVVHTYYDDWYLTGLSVKEDHGGKMAALYQRSANSTGYDNYLWTAAIGLEKSFIAGRSDMTIEEVQRRFDYGSNRNASYTERWSIPRTALDMRVETIQDETDQAKFPTEYTQEILTESFGGRSTATILFLRDFESRFATLDMGTDIVQSPGATIKNGLIDNSSIAVDLDPKYVSTEPDLQMNWASFRKSGENWEAYSLSEYSKDMQDTFVSLLRNDDNDSDITAGKALYLRGFYLSLSIGAQYSPFVLPKTDSDLKNLLKSRDAARILIKQFEPTHGTTSSAFKQIGAMRDSGEENSSAAGSSESAPLQGIGPSGGLANGTNTALNTYVLTMKNSGNGNTKEEDIQWEVAGAKTVIGVVGIAGAMGDAAKIAKLSKDVSSATRSANTARRGGLMLTSYTKVGKLAYGSKIAKAQKIKKAAKKAAVIGLVIGVGIAAGTFFYQWASGAIEPGTPQFKQAMAMMIAQIIVAVVLFIIEYFVPGGAIVVAVISLIDGLIMGICKAVGASSKDSFICDGIVMGVTKFIASMIYDYTPLIDMSEKNRLSVGGLDNGLVDPEKGFVVWNGIRYSVDVKSTLYRKTGSLKDALKTTMRYELTKKKEKGDQRIHKRLGLETDQMSSEWFRGDRPYIEVEPSQTITFKEAGLNKPEKGSSFYLAEGHATLAEEYKWGNTLGFLPGTKVVKADPDSSYFSMGPSVVYDVFPTSLEGFYNLVDRGNGYAFAWDSRFPTLADADGDGLRSAAFDGNDPDDSNPDIDGDGLTDFYEIQNASHGFDPTKKDTDGDGLSDYEEIIHETEPNKADSDYDGLLDKFEVEGWSYVYGFDSSGEPLQTIATANPFDNDTDDDTLTDYREMVFGTNPRVWSDPEVVKMTSEIDDKDGYVKPSQVINYTAHIQNKLLNRDIRGLLEVDFPAAVQDVRVQPKPFTLGPQKESTLKGSMKVSPDAQTQELNIVNRASSHIPNPQSKYVKPENKSRDSYVVRFDEPPGANAFSVGLQEKGAIRNLLCSDCPDSGLPGVYNQAVQFDKDDKLYLHSEFETLKSFGVWINPGDNQGADDAIIVEFLSGDTLFILSYDAQKQQVYFHNHNGKTYNSTTVPQGEWSFVSVSTGSSGSLSVNGKSTSLSGSTPSSLGPCVIGSKWRDLPSFVGLIDHLVIRENDSEDEMVREVPVITLHLDEEQTSTSTPFVNTNPFFVGHAYCEGGSSYCPTPVRGKVRNAMAFDTADMIKISLSGSDLNFRSYNAVSLWVKPTEDVGHDQFLLTEDHTYRNWGLWLDEDFKPNFKVSSHIVKADITVPLNEWTHISAVHQPAESSILLYINGSLAASKSHERLERTVFAGDVISIGGTSIGVVEGWKERKFVGVLDEISIFKGRSPSEDILPSQSEIRQIFNYQGAWYDAYSEHKVIIDADDPTIELDLAETHLAKRDVVLPIVAQDDTSGVIGVIYQINDGEWQTPTFDEGVWTFTYSPSEVGEQTITVFTMDRVGNSALSIKTIIIEDTPPVVTLNGAGERTPQPLTPEEDTMSWSATLSGKATESGEHDSGVDHLTVSVFDKYGGYIGKPKTVTSFGDDGEWSVDYSLGLKPDGFYPVQIEAVDKVGNRSTTDFTIALESSPPTADLLNTTPFVDEDGTEQPDVMAGTGDKRPTIVGTINDVPSPPNSVLTMHFEEPAGTTTFADSSDSRLTATCSGDACPQAASEGLYGYGVAFDGNDALTLTEGPTYRRTDTLRESDPDAYAAAAPLPIEEMSVVARVYVDEQNNMDGFVSAMQSVNGAEGGWMLGSRNGRFVFGLATDDADDGDGFITYLEARETYTTGQWYTVIGTYDGSRMKIYVDGEFQATTDVQSGPILYPDSAWYGIGSYRDGDETYPFTGRLDEIAVYDYALSSDDVTTMFAPASGVGTLEVALQHKRDEIAGKPLTWQNVPLTSGQVGQSYTRWSYQLPEGFEGVYTISLRATDASGNTTIIPDVWEGMIDTHAPRINLMAKNVNKGVEYTTTFEDFNFQQEGFASPCGIEIITQQDNYTEMWYGETYKSVDADGNIVPAPDRPYRLTAQCVLPGKIGYEEQSTLDGHSLELSGDVAFLFDGKTMKSFDMSDLSSPKKMHTRKHKLYGVAHSLRVDDATGRALLFFGDKVLARHVVSKPEKMRFTGYTKAREFKDLAIQGDYGYVTYSRFTHSLDIYSISRNEPKYVGYYYDTYYKPHMEKTDVTFMTIEAITEKYLFLNQGDRMLVVDITSSPDLKKVADVNKPADTYVVEGDYLYAVSRSGFSIYDISNIEDIPIPPTPNCRKDYSGGRWCDRVTRESLSPVGEYYNNQVKPFDIAVQGNTAYLVVKDGSSWSTKYFVYVFDITDKSKPVLFSTYKSPSTITDIEVSSNALYVETKDWRDKKEQRVLTLKGDDLLKADACDIYGNCTDFSRDTQTYAAQGVNFNTTADLPQASSSPPSVAPVDVSVGPLPSVLSEPEPITISLSLVAEAGMKDLTVTMEGQTLTTQSWSQADAVTRTFVSVPWTPPAEGSYSLVVEATDHAGNTDRDDEMTILLDTQPPQVGVHQSALGLHQYDTAQDEFVLSGEVIDDASLAYLDVVLTMGDTDGTVETLPVAVRDPGGDPLYLPATFPSGSAVYATMQWEARWALTNAIPSGLDATVVVTATDLAGRESVVEQPLVIDGVAPSNVDMTLSYNADGNTTTIITPGMTLSEVRDPEMVISWEPANDANGIKQYLVGWTTSPEVNLSELASYDPGSASHTQQVGDAQRWYAHVVAEDQAGNRTTTTRGPIYVDYATTPTYISMEENGTTPYRSWAEASCSMVGMDNRIYARKNNLASLDDGQRFYATWNHDGLRMMWTGAQWETDGDLFIYLDTKEGGSSQLYDPYPATITNTVILLPPRNDMASLAAIQSAEAASTQATSPRPIVRPRLSATSGPMAADTLIWVQSDDTATLMQWDGEAWQTVADGLSYHFDQNLPTPTTDLYVPFSTLGISEPASTTLSLLAVASEEDALRLWATMPPRNNLNSERIVDSAGASEFQQFALTKSYSWQLADGMCPGVVSDTPGTAQGAVVQQDATEGSPTGADMSVSISSYPSGVAYSLLNDNLFFAMKDLPQFAGVDWGGVGNAKATFCANNPDDPSCERDTAKPTVQGGDTSGVRLESLTPIGGGVDFNVQEELNATMSVDTPPLGNGNPVVYTIELQNTGTVASRDVVVDIYTWGPIRLPGGEYRTDAAGEYDYQSLQVGDIAAGERRAISFPAIVDTSFDTQNQHGKATIDVTVYDSTGSHQHLDDGSDIYTNELEWLYVDHEVDTSPPDYIEIQSPRGILTRGKNVVSGFVYDRSLVPQVEVEVLLPDGSSRMLTCEDDTPDDGQWECIFDAGSISDGAEVQMRARATDTYGATGAWSGWVPFIVDTIAPTVLLDATSKAILSDGYIGEREALLSGTLWDNVQPSGIEVCRTVDNVNNTDDTDDTAEVCEQLPIVLSAEDERKDTYIYEDVPLNPAEVGANTPCDNPLTRGFDVPEEDNFVLSKVSMGLNISHTLRSDLNVMLQSPKGTKVTMLYDGTNAQNYNVLIDDASTMLDRDDKNDHSTNSPFYQNQRGGYGLLSAFKGENAAGRWTLSICDAYPAEDDGFYNRSQLFLSKHTTPVSTTAMWEYEVPLDEPLAVVGETMEDEAGDEAALEPTPADPTTPADPPTDGADPNAGGYTLFMPLISNGDTSQVGDADGSTGDIAPTPPQPTDDSASTQTVAIYGLDSMGNRSVEPLRFTYVVDNEPPVIQPSNTTTITLKVDDIYTDSTRLQVSGTVNDQPSGVREMWFTVMRPESVMLTDPLTVTNGTWTYSSTRLLGGAGTYQWWAEAYDYAGNLQQVGPYTIVVEDDVEDDVDAAVSDMPASSKDEWSAQ